MKESQSHAAPGSAKPEDRIPYSAPRIERLGSMAELTATTPITGTATDAEYGPGDTNS